MYYITIVAMEQFCAQFGWCSVAASNEVHLWSDTS